MELNDLLVSYNLVVPATFEEKPVTPDNAYDRMLKYIEDREPTEELLPAEEAVAEPNDAKFAGWSNIPKMEKKVYTSKVKKGEKQAPTAYFLANLNKYLKNNPNLQDYRKVFIDIAREESGFNLGAVSKYSTAKGWFQFLDGTRKLYSNANLDKFMSDPQEQLSAAGKNLNSIIQRMKKFSDKRGLTDSLIVYAYWWRPKSIEFYLKNGYNDGYVGPDGMTLFDIFNKMT